MIDIETLMVFRGAMALVLELAALHRAELREDWQRARKGETPKEIEPLD
jgi:hypothetical protein